MPDTTAKATVARVPYTHLFRFATVSDVLLTILGCLCGVANGVVFPCFSVIFGKILNSYASPPAEGFEAVVNEYSLIFALLASGAAVASYFQTALPMLAAERQAMRLRSRYLAALLRQPPAWHDTHGDAGELSARLSENVILIQAGMGEKLTGALQQATTFFAGLVVGFVTSWKLTLVIFACTPMIVILIALLKNSTSRHEKDATDSYARAGDAVTEALSLVRSVAAFGGERAEVARYDGHLATAQAAGARKGWIMGSAVGGMFGVMFLTYAVAMGVASVFVIQSRAANPACMYEPSLAGCFSGGDVIRCFMAVLIGAFALGQAGPNFASMASAQAAAVALFKVIDSAPAIDTAGGGAKPDKASLKGHLEFRGVTFSYPSRPEVKVLDNFSLTVRPGEHLALVGESGSGKSTLVLLLLRFYDVEAGAVLVDGLDVKEWDVAHLRECLALVSQEPLLFSASLRENIAMGLPEGAPLPAGGVEAAAASASAHDFISALPNGYDTVCGTSTATTLSGGQRQRVCIARALLRDPRILLLDEATSALDNASERAVQAAIDDLLSGRAAGVGGGAGSKRTSLVIAHRLSTITGADRIAVLAKGRVVEEGRFGELMAREGGLFHALWALQDVSTPRSSPASPSSASGAHAATAPPTAAAPAAAAAAAPAAPPRAAAPHADAPKKKATAGAHAAAAEEKAWDALVENDLPEVSSARVWAMQMEDWGLMALTFFASLVSGCVQPCFGLVYSDFIVAFFQPDDALRASATTYGGAFVGIAAVIFFSTWIRIGASNLLGEKLTRKLRVLSYEAVLRQPMAFFDAPRNAVGRLNTRLGVDAALVRGGTGESLGQVLQGCAAIVCAIVISLTASWRLGLVLLSVMPLVALGAKYQNKAFVGFSVGAAKALEESGHVAQEAASGLRVVAAFGLQGRVSKAYEEALQAPLAAGVARAWQGGLGLGFSQFMQFIVYSIAFYAGGRFMDAGLLTFPQLMRVFLAVTMASQAVGSAMSWGPDRAKAHAAMRSIFQLLDTPSPIDPLAGATRPAAHPLRGALEFKDVSFSYPSRKDVPVLAGFSLAIAPGERVGVVGASGCGKSTLVALAERFYDPDKGAVCLDGVDLRAWGVAELRRALGLVSQEPALFADSIAYNIGYGTASGEKPAPGKAAPLDAAAVPVAGMEVPDAVRAAAAGANCANFIAELPAGFQTNVGARGSQLSGGQRQRVAIARAVLREPAVMLLDEATAALDSESERVVQAALDAVLNGERGKQTALIVAHRLSTLKNCDRIVVVAGGAVAEAGTHEELLAMRGRYWRLAQQQQADA